MAEKSIKEEAHDLVDELPENAGWDELMRRITVRKAIEEGREDIKEGRTISTDELKARLENQE